MSNNNFSKILFYYEENVFAFIIFKHSALIPGEDPHSPGRDETRLRDYRPHRGDRGHAEREGPRRLGLPQAAGGRAAHWGI